MHKVNWFLKHSEEVGGVIFGLLYNVFGLDLHGSPDLLSLLEKLYSNLPDSFWAGFWGGLGGLVIRLSSLGFVWLANKWKKNEKAD